MRIEARLRKIRLIQRGNTDVYGVAIPPSLSSWFGLYVSVIESGNKLILESGCPPVALTKQMINDNSINMEKFKI